MGTLQKFVRFAESLDAEERAHVDKMLRHLMTNNAADIQLSLEQEAEDDKRFNDPKPKYVTQAEIEATCGRSMPS